MDIKLSHAVAGAGASAILSTYIAHYIWTKRIQKMMTHSELTATHIDWVTQQIIKYPERFPPGFLADYHEKLAYLTLTQEIMFSDEIEKTTHMPLWLKSLLWKEKD